MWAQVVMQTLDSRVDLMMEFQILTWIYTFQERSFEKALEAWKAIEIDDNSRAEKSLEILKNLLLM